MRRVKITLICGDNEQHTMGTYIDTMQEKYPLWCEQCEETAGGKYPFTIRTEIIDD